VKPKGNLVTAKGTIEFIVGIDQTKYEIKKYLKQMYNIDVIKVNTIIYNGKMKRDAAGKYFKRKAQKKAIVTVDNTFWLDQQFQNFDKLGAQDAEVANSSNSAKE
jgi:ribosomal protein L23